MPAPGPDKSLVSRLFEENERGLRGFFRRRVRSKSDVPDLTQEVYLRMLRVAESDVLQNPEAYLYYV